MTQWMPLAKIMEPSGGRCVHSTQPSSALFPMSNQTLARGGYRYMITGMFDEKSLEHCSSLRVIAERGEVATGPAHTSHIPNDSTMQGIGPARTDEKDSMVNKARFYPQAPSPPPYSPIIQGYHAAGAMAILEQFGFSDLPEAFKKASFHWPCDLLSLEPILHYKFGPVVRTGRSGRLTSLAN